ncbi:unnamed protein product [Triticum turgidum subsp. durum]|uniref:Uncharacterized protein n=1 Tax=Triticum turgidum subsp. durum TaxID=4567 RepID=A0A9R0T2S8_TRITD|nr:unnamed protein product [Triticum turgidum subsp. durum]
MLLGLISLPNFNSKISSKLENFVGSHFLLTHRERPSHHEHDLCQAKDRLKKRRAKAIKVDKEGDLKLEDLDDPTEEPVEQDNTTSKKKKGSHKKPPKSQDNNGADGVVPESGPVEDEEHIASLRPKRSKRLVRSTGEDKEPVAACDVEKPADAAENNDNNDAEELQSQTPSA